MAADVTRPTRSCWCGNAALTDFSEAYAACCECGTLVSRGGLRPEEVEVRDDDHDFYGKPYWLSRQRDELGFPDIYGRVRLDLPERCLHWLRTLLNYRLPPARILELGSGHGAFVALMRAAGFEATGLELSPWVVDFARSAFGIPVLLGPIEAQSLPERSLGAIVLNDVLEHLADPLNSTRRCAELLGADGFVQAQTPCYPDGQNHRQLVETNHPFLAMLQEREHLYLFSRRAVHRLFAAVGLANVRFESALFPYDMVVVASAHELMPTDPRLRDEILLASPPARFVRAMIDLDDRAMELSRRVDEIESDRKQRIAMIEHLNRHIEQTSRDDEARQEVIREQRTSIDKIGQQIVQLSGDYEARGQVIRDQQIVIDDIERDRRERLATIERLNRHIEDTSADYETRGQVIRDQQAAIDAGQHEISRLTGELVASEARLASLASESEARARVIADQQATIEKLARQSERRASR